MPFLFCLDCKRAYAAEKAKANPSAITAKQDNQDDRANQCWANDGHGKTGVPKAPAKGRNGVEVETINEYDLDNDEVASIGARVLAPCQALAASNVASIGTRAPAPRQPSAASAIRGQEAGTRRFPTAPAQGGHGAEAKNLDKYNS